MVIDKYLILPSHLQLFNRQQKTIVFNTQKEDEDGMILYSKIEPNENILQQVLDISYKLGIQSILVEGGTKLLQSLIDAGFWDETRVITNDISVGKNGIAAPVFHQQNPYKKETIQTDTITYYTSKRINE
jgi:diaminohydroxyphosphoribosylaminopyrimidine deaminase/5-amino-6-(5-phosphoribosylamino)uracil reductase